MQALVEEASALGRAGSSLCGCDLSVLAILFVPGSSVAEGWEGENLVEGWEVDRVCGVGGGGAATDECFRFLQPAAGVTVVRYAVPHTRTNGAGHPLPKDQSCLFPEDAERVNALCRHLYPEFFVGSQQPASETRGMTPGPPRAGEACGRDHE